MPSTEPTPPADTISASRGPVASLLATEEHRSDDENDDNIPANHNHLHPPQQPGDLGRLSHYRILKVLGAGGMGLVYLGEDFLLKRPVAIKVMLPEYAKRSSAKTRFLREARAAAAIEHDNIIPIFEVNEDNGCAYLVMPLLKGESLADRLKRETKLSLADAIHIAEQTALGLAEAHEHGLIHRDIKPSNIWLESKDDGVRKTNDKTLVASLTASVILSPFNYRVKILDFGLARTEETDGKLTKSGTVLGTPAYMSPEQARNPHVDGRADLFSLGVMMYQMATGTLPFKGHDMMSFLAAVSFDTPEPPRRQNPEISQDLDELISKLLEKDPANRIQSAGEVADRLAAISDVQRPLATMTASPSTVLTSRTSAPNSASPTPPSAAKARRVWPIALVVLVSLIGLGILIPQIIVRIRNLDGSETEIKAPKGAEVEVVENGKTIFPPPETKTKNPPPVQPVVDDPRPSPEIVESLDDDLPEWEFAEGSPPPAVAPFDAAQAVKHQDEWANFLNVKTETSNRFGMTFRLIPPGEIETKDAAGKPYKIRVVRPFSLGATEVTVEQFRKFVDETNYVTRAERLGQGLEAWTWVEKKGLSWKTPGFEVRPNAAVTQMTSEDAASYCAWLSEKTGDFYRLPTCEEWEFAARGGGVGRFGWCPENQLKEYAWSKDTIKPSMDHDVGSKKANPFGLFDVLGSVREIVRFQSPHFAYKRIGTSFSGTTSGEFIVGHLYGDHPSADGGFRIVRLPHSDKATPQEIFGGAILAKRNSAASPVSLVSRPPKIAGLRTWSVELQRPFAINQTVWNGDGSRLASADGWNNSVRIYDAKGNVDRILMGFNTPVRSVDWSSDGRWIAAVDVDSLHIFEAKTGQRRAVFSAGSNSPYVRISPNSRFVICVSPQSSRLVDLKTGIVRTLGNAMGVVWSPDSKKVFVWTESDGDVEIWNMESFEKEAAWKAAKRRVSALLWPGDGTKLVTGAEDSSLVVWDAATQKPLRSVNIGNWISAIAGTPNLDRIWIACQNRAGYLLRSDSPPKILPGYFGPTLALSSDGKTLATLNADRSLKFRDGDNGAPLFDSPKNGLAVWYGSNGWTGTVLTKDSLFTKFQNPEARVRRWDPATGRAIGTPRQLAGENLLPRPDGEQFLAVRENPRADGFNLFLYKGTAAESAGHLGPHPGRVRQARWSPDGLKVATLGEDRVIRIWLVEGNKLERELKGHSDGDALLAWSPDGKSLASLGREPSLRIWTVGEKADPLVVAEFPPGVDAKQHNQNGGQQDVAWLPNGKEILTVLNSKFMIWKVAEQKWVGPIERDIRRHLVNSTGHKSLVINQHSTRFVDLDTSNRFVVGHSFHTMLDSLSNPLVAFRGDDLAMIGPFGFDLANKKRLGALMPSIIGNHWLCVSPDGHWRGGSLDNPGDGTTVSEIEAVEQHLAYVAQTVLGEWIRLNPVEFEIRFGWKNDPNKAFLLKTPSR